MEALDDPNISEDISVPVGCDLQWSFSLEPWDSTGASGAFILGGVPHTMTITMSGVSPDVTSTFSVHLTPGQLATALLNVPGASAPYQVQWTATDGTIWPIGYGSVWVPNI